MAVAKDFLRKCFARNPRHRSTAAQLLEHPFLASAFHDVDAEPAKQDWIMSPESTLNAEFWESDEESETEDMLTSAAERIGSLASPCSALPDWESDDGWIVVHGGRPEASETTTPTAIAGTDFGPWSEEGLEAEVDVHFADADAGRCTLQDALWDSDTDDEEADETPAERIGALACGNSALPDWDSEDGWIDVCHQVHRGADSPPADVGYDLVWPEESDAEREPSAVAADDSNGIPRNAVGLIEPKLEGKQNGGPQLEPDATADGYYDMEAAEDQE
ncbi:hypothetical protein TRIUR3_24048 [Triticum urartu]|uniref:Uncharacterized protein n=1 Tax=Triticum urartu TaxID=4572 RepID=M7YRQ3_TRIUA|nr:hypothetical protein TRIUR3_24048 [Triticum urartu]